MPQPYLHPGNTIWFVLASDSDPDGIPSAGSAVVIRLQKTGKPETVSTYLLTCAHVLRRENGERFPVIHAWPPNTGFDKTAGLRVRIAEEMKGWLGAQDTHAHDDWVVLEFVNGEAQAKAADFVDHWVEGGLAGRVWICGFPGGTRSFGERNVVLPTSTELFPVRDEGSGAFQLVGDGTRAGISGGGVFETDNWYSIFESNKFIGIHRGRDDGTLQLQGVSGKHILERLREQNYERPSRSSRRRHLKTWVKRAIAVVLLVSADGLVVNWLSTPPPPRVDYHLPNHEEENVDRNSTIIVKFNHAVTVSGSSLTLSQRSQESSSPPEMIKLDPVVMKGVEFSDTLQFQTTWLGCKTTYTATLNGIVDARGRSSRPAPWTFTTQDGDCEPPTVDEKYSYPKEPDKATMRPTIGVRFNEAVTLRTFQLDEKAPDGTMTCVELDGFVYNYDGRNSTLKAKPVAKLTVEKWYQVTVPAAKDLSNNTMAKAYTWEFKTPARATISFQDFIKEIDQSGADIAAIEKQYVGKRVCWEGTLAKEPRIDNKLLDLVDGCKPNEPTRHHAAWTWNKVTDFPPFLRSGAVVRLEGTIIRVSSLGIDLSDAEPCEEH